jgi:hypothetical protein
MFRTTAIVLALGLPVTAQAECYVRSAMTNQTAVKITSIADVQPMVVPISATQNKCIVTFRAQVDGAWITAEGESAGSKSLSDADLCRGAMDQGRAQILSRADGGRMTIEQNMVCTDRPEIQVRQVRIGDQVRESEVRPHPNFPKTFNYRGTQCRWFVEPEIRGGDLLQRQGIVCRSHGPDWKVVDKW